MKKIFIFMAICHAINCSAQTQKEPVLFGSIPVDTLSSAPYQSWYSQNYNNYQINAGVKNELASNQFKNISIEAFFGSWCGDSKREVPRFKRILDETGFAKKNFKLIGLGAADSLYKQSPGAEEKGKAIFRVPVFIVYKNGKEIGRINEYPVESLERDLLNIVKEEGYTPNYKSFGLIKEWLNDDILLDSNISLRGLTARIRPLPENEYEINSVAKLVARQGLKKEGLKLLMINAALYPASTVAITSLAEAYIDHDYKKEAVVLLEKSLEAKPAESSRPLIDLLLKAKTK
jgi:thiol-disulfide isomerase/thioredoxin